MSSLPVFPRTRCPDCGTESTGRICPACLFVIWRRVYRAIDPDRPELGIQTAYVEPLHIVRHGSDSPTDLRMRVYFQRGEADEEGRLDLVAMFGGHPVEPYGSGWGWWWCELHSEKMLDEELMPPDFSGNMAEILEHLGWTGGYDTKFKKLVDNGYIKVDDKSVPGNREKYYDVWIKNPEMAYKRPPSRP
jgi:hypothetical protein